MESGKGKLEWMEFDLLKKYPNVAHGVFERHGGVSKAPFSSLNLSNGIGDQADCVKVNRERVAASLGAHQMVFANEIHGVNIVRITSQNSAKTHEADAYITTEKNIGLAMTHADCQAAIFFDPKHQALALAHVGWRGNVQNLYGKLVDAMKQQIGTDPHDLLVCVSPSLGPDHAEFKNYKQEFPKEFWDFQVKPHYFDLWAISKNQLTSAGVPAKNIEIASVCNYCDQDFFSYRRDKETGRNATAAVLK